MTAEDLPDRLFYGVPEVSEMCRTDQRTLRRMVQAGEIPAKRFGTKILIPANWVRAQAAGAATPPAPPPLAPDEFADLVADRVLARLARAVALATGHAHIRDALGDGGDAPTA